MVKKIHPVCLFFDSPFSNFCQKKGTVSKKRHRVKKKAFLKQNFQFLSKKRHFCNKICDFCQKKGTLSKKRHRVKKKALKKKTFLGKKFKPHSQSFIEKGFRSKLFPFWTYGVPFFTHFFYILPFFRFIFKIFVYAFFRPLFFAKFFNKLKKKRGNSGNVFEVIVEKTLF